MVLNCACLISLRVCEAGLSTILYRPAMAHPIYPMIHYDIIMVFNSA